MGLKFNIDFRHFKNSSNEDIQAREKLARTLAKKADIMAEQQAYKSSLGT